MKKTSAVLALIIVVSLFMNGCSAKSDKPKDETNTLPEKIKIGVLEPLSGSNAAGGELERMGIDLAHDMFPTVTIDGKEIPVKLKYADNKSDKQESVNAAKSLVADFGANMVIGSWGSDSSIAAGPVFKEFEVPAIGVSCTNPKVTLGNEYYFRVCFTDAFQGLVMAEYVFNEAGKRKIAILRESTSSYSVALSKIFEENFKKLTGDDACITGVSDYNTGDQDFSAQLEFIRNSGAEAVFLPGNFTESALVMKQARELSITIPFFGTDNWETPEFLDVAGDAAEGAVYSSAYDPTQPLTEMTAVFLKAYAKKYGKDALASGATALGFEAYILARETIEKTGSIDGPTLRDNLAKTEGFQGVTGVVNLDNNGDAVKPVVLKTVENGRFVYKSLVEPAQ